MIIYHQNNVAAFVGAHIWYFQFQPVLQSRISVTTVAPAAGRIMSSLVAAGGLAARGGIAGEGGGLAA